MALSGNHINGDSIFAGKRALVIGGSGGIGRAIAFGLAFRGADVTITGGNSSSRLEQTLAEMNETTVAEGRNPKHTGFICKIGGPEGFSPQDAAAFILKQSGSPDILVISWGPFKKNVLQDTAPGDWHFLIENNLIFPGIMVSLVLRDMLDRGWGRILLFGGTKTAEIRGYLNTAAYSAAKTALGTLVKSVAKSVKNTEICCNIICPGLTITEYSDPVEFAHYREKYSGAKLLAVQDIADYALGVLESPAVNGAIIPVDGGLWV